MVSYYQGVKKRCLLYISGSIGLITVSVLPIIQCVLDGDVTQLEKSIIFALTTSSLISAVLLIISIVRYERADEEDMKGL